MANYSNIKRERFMPKIHFLEQEFYFVDPVSAIKLYSQLTNLPYFEMLPCKNVS